MDYLKVFCVILLQIFKTIFQLLLNITYEFCMKDFYMKTDYDETKKCYAATSASLFVAVCIKLWLLREIGDILTVMYLVLDEI